MSLAARANTWRRWRRRDGWVAHDGADIKGCCSRARWGVADERQSTRLLRESRKSFKRSDILMEALSHARHSLLSNRSSVFSSRPSSRALSTSESSQRPSYPSTTDIGHVRSLGDTFVSIFRRKVHYSLTLLLAYCYDSDSSCRRYLQ